MTLENVHKGVHTHKARKRIGRGPGSGTGKTSGRGHKGAKSNPGYAALPIFEGGTMPLVRRIPKRGFTNIFAVTVAAVNVGDLEQLFNADDSVTPESMREKSLLKSRYDVLKILGDGELTKKLTVTAHRFSKSARDKIEKAGGTAVVIPGKITVAHKKAERLAAAKLLKNRTK